MSREKTRMAIAVAIVAGLVGTGAGYFIPRQRDVRFVREECHEIYHKYMSFTNTIQDYILPYNETDNVTLHITGTHIRGQHEVESEYGLRYFEIGLSEEGFIRYIEEWKTLK